MKSKKKKPAPEFNREDLLKYMRLPAAKKLEYLEKLNKFLSLTTPKRNKRIWEKLKHNGW
jgi:hypothetical protein